jgi:nicotinamide riboside kinase
MERKNIYVVGAQCTGKTTLVKALADRFAADSTTEVSTTSPPVIIKEVARSVLKEHAFVAADIRNSEERAFEFQKLILKAQAEAESFVSSGGDRFISDRSGLDCLIYAQMYAGPGAPERLMKGEDWRQCLRLLSDALIVVCEPVLAWSYDDGTRLMPTDDAEWIQLHATFSQFLERLGLAYVILSKDITDQQSRVDFVMGKLEDQEAARDGILKIDEGVSSENGMAL